MTLDMLTPILHAMTNALAAATQDALKIVGAAQQCVHNGEGFSLLRRIANQLETSLCRIELRAELDRVEGAELFQALRPLSTSATRDHDAAGKVTNVPTTKHTHPVVFGRKVTGCPRCAELLAGAAPVKWAKRNDNHGYPTRAELAAHDCKARNCGPVCTFGDW